MRKRWEKEMGERDGREMRLIHPQPNIVQVKVSWGSGGVDVDMGLGGGSSLLLHAL